MKPLSDAVPTDLFTPIFQNVREEVVATDIKGLMASRPKDIGGIGMFIWDELVHRKLVADPFKIAPIVNNGFKGIYQFIRQEVKQHPISDVYAVSYFNEITPRYSFVDVSLVQCLPNDIHIADVEFADTRHPLTGQKPRKGVHSYRGLHVFGDFIDRLRTVARSRNISRISLMVGDSDLYPVFSRYGFTVSDTRMAQAAFHGPRIGFPMILHVN